MILFPALSQASPVKATRNLSLKSGLEILYGYETALGVSHADTKIRTAYKKTVDRLPLRGDLTELTPPMHLATVELSGAYCARTIELDRDGPSTRQKVFTGVRFSEPPSQFAMVDRVRLIQKFSMLFWGRDASTAELNSVLDSLDALQEGHFEDSSRTTVLLQTLCVSFGTSLSFLVKS